MTIAEKGGDDDTIESILTAPDVSEEKKENASAFLGSLDVANRKVHPSACRHPSVHPPIHPFIHLSFHPSIHLSIQPFTGRPVLPG